MVEILSFITGFGYWFGVDVIFWLWAIFTVAAFANLFIPDPVPFVDEFLLFAISVLLLMVMAARGTATLLSKTGDILSNPGVLAFLITMGALYIGGKLYNRRKGK